MKVYVIIFLMIFSVNASAQEIKPFTELVSLVAKKNGWTFDRKENAALFHKERKRLGDSFIPELVKFLSDDIDRHYNAAMFLSEPYYLGNEKPMNETALLIYHQGIILTQKSSDTMDKHDELPFRVLTAILSQRMGYKALAVYHKSAAEALIKTKEYEGCFPAIDDNDREVYDGIKDDALSVK